MILHLCETCDLVLTRMEVAEHEALGHKGETITLLRRQRGKGNRVETQWSSAWVRL